MYEDAPQRAASSVSRGEYGRRPPRGRMLRDALSVIVVAAPLALLAGGCAAPRPVRNVTNPDPSGKIPAIKQAVRDKNARAAPQLVKDLNSEDPAVRFFAIGALRRLTGETLGYQYFDDEPARTPAVKRWEQWLHERGNIRAETDEP